MCDEDRWCCRVGNPGLSCFKGNSTRRTQINNTDVSKALKHVSSYSGQCLRSLYRGFVSTMGDGCFMYGGPEVQNTFTMSETFSEILRQIYISKTFLHHGNKFTERKTLLHLPIQIY